MKKRPMEVAFDYTMSVEGSEYTNDPNDPGGPTKYGVSLRAHAAEIGDLDGDGDVDGDDVKLLTRADALEIYRSTYWSGASKFEPPVALMVADMAYHHGLARAIKILQTACNALGFNLGAVDGVTGPKTRAAVKSALKSNPREFLAEVQKQRLDFMRSLRNFEVYKNGWTRRCFTCALAAGELV